MDNYSHDKLGGDPYLFDADMYNLIYDYASYTTMPDVRDICYEYADIVEVIPAGNYFVYAVTVDAKYFSDLYSKMKAHGYSSCHASPLGKSGSYRVKFSKRYDDHIKTNEL